MAEHSKRESGPTPPAWPSLPRTPRDGMILLGSALFAGASFGLVTGLIAKLFEVSAARAGIASGFLALMIVIPVVIMRHRRRAP